MFDLWLHRAELELNPSAVCGLGEVGDAPNHTSNFKAINGPIQRAPGLNKLKCCTRGCYQHMTLHACTADSFSNLDHATIEREYPPVGKPPHCTDHSQNYQSRRGKGCVRLVSYPHNKNVVKPRIRLQRLARLCQPPPITRP